MGTARDRLQVRACELQRNMDDIANETTLTFYRMDIAPVMAEVYSMLTEPERIVFQSAPTRPADAAAATRQGMAERERKYRRKKLVRSFMAIAARYDPSIDAAAGGGGTAAAQPGSVLDGICQTCGHRNISMDDSITVCTACGIETELIHMRGGSAFLDNSRVCMSNSRYSYDRKIHFRDTLLAFQGKQSTKIPPELVAHIEREIERNHLGGPAHLPRRARNHRVTKENVRTWLHECNNGASRFYDDLTLIHHLVTDQPMPDISQLEPRIYADFERLTEVYDSLNKGNRSNFLSSNYVLLTLLRRHGLYTNLDTCDEFNLLKTFDRLRYHDTVCGIMFSILGWDFRSVL
jgi:hypothetical protein